MIAQHHERIDGSGYPQKLLAPQLSLQQLATDPASYSTRSGALQAARTLAGQRISANANGSAESAGKLVDDAWPDHLDDARAVLRQLREPDQAMAAAGDVAIWERMVLAAIEEAKPQTVVL